MNYKNLLKNSIKYSVAVFAFLAAPEIYAQKQPKKDTISKENQIEEVVMVGFGSVKKKDLTGSVSTVSGADLEKRPVSNVAESLQGKIAGVKVTTAEGSPDADVGIVIRGGGSITQDSSPLVIVDGFPVNSLSDIAPSDIENVTILKDASSTAIYGSRGANGVILVTTKSGKSGGKINVSINSYIGYKKIAKKIDVLSPLDYAKWQHEFAVLKGDLPSYENYFGTYATIGKYANYKGTDWQDAIYGRTGEVYSNDFNVRGGNDKTSFSINLARYQEYGIQIGSDFQRDNISFNLKNKPSKKVDLALTFRYSNSKIGGSGANEQKEFSATDSRLRHAVGYSPIDLPGVTTDDTDEALAGYLVNPYTAVADNDRSQERRNYNILGSFGWNIIKNLDFKSDIGMDFYRSLDSRFYGRTTYYVSNIPLAIYQGLPALIFGTKEDQRFRSANTLTYDFKSYLGSKHKLKLLLGQELINYKSTILTNTVHGFPKSFSFDDATSISILGRPQSVSNIYLPDDNLLSFFGRVNYEFNNKYLFTATIRGDGSSKFAGNNKWGYFPSVAGAWKINEENFLKNTEWINQLKLRVSYGQSGNNNIPTNQTQLSLGSYASDWIHNVSNYIAPSTTLVNPALKWETTTSQNVGMDYELFKRRLSGTVEVYKNKATDLLILFPILQGGYNDQYRNLGETENKGLEASLNYDAIKKKDYGLSFSVNVGFNKNNINSLGNLNNFGFNTNWASTSIGNDYLVQVGESLGVMYGYVSDGRYEVSDFNYAAGVYTLKTGVASNSTVVGNVAPGTMKLKDINGDGKVDINDRTIIGNALPKSTGGFNINANVKNFDFSAAFNWSIGNDIYNASKIESTSATVSSPSGQYRNLSTEVADGIRWTNIDPNTGLQVTDPTALAALNATTTMWSPYQARFVLSDWAIEDGSFLRLNTVTLGYSLPDSFVSKLKLTKFRVYATLNNVFVITKYSGMDPEVNTRRATPLTPGVDYSPYPKSRQAVFGVNVNF